MRRRTFGACVTLALVAACADAPPPPNIVLIIGDDHGYTDFGFMGSSVVQTPNLDRLASEGVVFRRGMTTASICRPSLLTLLTGLYPYQWRFYREMVHWPRDRWQDEGKLVQRVRTLPRTLSRLAAYESMAAGKLFETSFAQAGFNAGFERGTGQARRWTGGVAVGRETMEPVFEFISKERDVPFFLWFAPLLPHYPHDAPARYEALYADAELSASARAYYANITRFDDVIGALLNHLDETGLRERTLVVYLADNGWDQPPDVEYPVAALWGGPKGKGTMHELGVRTPLIFRWPGVVPEGEERDELVSSVDLVPTFMDYAGLPVPPDLVGHSLRGLIDGTSGIPREAIVGWASELRPSLERARRTETAMSREEAYSVRTDRWRYIRYEERDPAELYDMRVDPGETTNVVDRHPGVVTRLEEQITAWVEDLRARPRALTLPKPRERP